MPLQVGDGVGEMVHRDRLDPRERHLGARLGGADEPAEPRAASTLGGDQRSGYRSHAPVERELAEGGDAVECVARQLLRRGEHGERDRQVEPGAFLPEAGRCEVDRDPSHGELELGGGDAAPHPFLRLLARPVGEPDDREGGTGELQVRLDLDPARIETDERVGDRASEHAATLGGEV